MSWARYFKVVSKLSLAGLALGIVAGGGNAVTAYQGKFTLPFEVYWGGSTLPAGDYKLYENAEPAVQPTADHHSDFRL